MSRIKPTATKARVVVAILACSLISLLGIKLFATQVRAQVTDQNPQACGTASTPANACFTSFMGDLNAIKSKPNVEGMLLFSPLGDNADERFEKHIIPPGLITQLCGGATCQGSEIGINPGTVFGRSGSQHPAEFGFDWFLQIAEKNNSQAVITTINSLPANTKSIIRIGVGGNGGGFDGDPQSYISFLAEVYAGLSPEKKESTYAIAGPNEPDIEWDWFAKDQPAKCQGHGKEGDTKSVAFYECIGPVLANYMNAVIAGNPGFKLLSPAFNMTSFTLQDQKSTGPKGIFYAMDEAGANWGGLDGIAGNLYPAGAPMTQHWTTNNIDALLAKAGKPLIITETGPYNCNLVNATCVNQDSYYIQPINGVNSQSVTLLNSGPEKLDIIRDELIMQGYEARCATPGMKISLTEQGRGAMQKLFEQPGINGVVLGGLGGAPSNVGSTVAKTDAMYSRLDVDYRDILVPLFRDLDKTQPNIKRSIEDFLGHKATDESVYTTAELKTSAINSLLTSEQRCAVAYQNLLAQDTMCKKLADPAQCALYATKIPKTSYTVKTLFSALETARADQSVPDFCKKLVGSSATATAPLRKGVANAPLTIERAYRLAFMVTSIRLRAPSQSKLLNILTHPLAGWMGPPKPNHAVVVVAFKIPDVLTNKGFNNGYTTDTAYDDVGTLTKNSLISQSAQAKIEADALERRTKLLDTAREYSTVVQHDSWAEIVCLGGGVKVAGVGSPQCQDPLTKALVDIINAQVMVGKLTKPAPEPTPAPAGPATEWSTDEAEGALADASTTAGLGFGDLLDGLSGDDELKCSDDYETAKNVNDSGALNSPDDPSHVFTENWGAALLSNLFGDCTHGGEGLGDPGFASTQTPETGACTGEDWYLKSKFFVVKDMLADNGGDDEDLAVKHFLVYPVGYELKTVEGVLAGSFFTKKQLSDVLELQRNEPKLTEKMVDQFQLDKSKIGFDGAEDSYGFTDKNDCSEYINAEGELSYKCKDLSFSMRLIASAPKAANILGAKLGYWMRKIQLSLNATTQESFGYLQKCATLEEFLLDRCGGTAATLRPAGETAGSSKPGGTCSSTTTLAEIGYEEPSTLPFTGKATYYAPNVFNTTLNSRLSGVAGSDFVGNTTVKDCEVLGKDFAEAKIGASLAGQEFVGCVALLRVGDLYFRNSWNDGNPDPNNVRKVWLKNKAGMVHGPFAVIDVAAGHDAACLYDQGWAVDIDYNSFKRLFNQTAGPDQVTVCDSDSC